jgi:hypothetical protein
MSSGFRLDSISARQVDAVSRVKLTDFLRRLPRGAALRGSLREAESFTLDFGTNEKQPEDFISILGNVPFMDAS